jgi:hypothetical protein
VKCISKSEPAPIAIVEWCTKRRRYLSDTDQHAFLLIDIVSQFINIYSNFKSGGYSDEEAIIEELLAIETELQLWEAQAPEVWEFAVEPNPGGLGQNTFNGRTHIYRDLWSVFLEANYLPFNAESSS